MGMERLNFFIFNNFKIDFMFFKLKFVIVNILYMILFILIFFILFNLLKYC